MTSANSPGNLVLHGYAGNLARLVVHTATEMRQRLEQGRMSSQSLAAATQALARALAALAGMHDVDDMETWWLLMDVHACALDLKDARVAVDRATRTSLKPDARAEHDRRVREAACANMKARFVKLGVVVPRLWEKLQTDRMTPEIERKNAEDLVVAELAEVVFQHLYAAKGASAYEHFATALGYLGRTLSRGALMNKLSLWRKQGRAPGLMPIDEI